MAGTKYLKCDFHIHTPASFDYKDKDITPDDIVNTAIENDLDVIAITDHNNFGWVDYVRSAAKDKELIVLPGVEITAKGGHVLALFNPDTGIVKIRELLNTVGIYEENYGKESTIGADFTEVVNKIKDFGGVAIAAHADGSKGFLTSTSQGQVKIEIYKDENLSAIEIVDENSLPKYTTGTDPNYSRKMACIQGSDAHTLEDIGKRATLLKMDQVNVEGLFQVFNEPILRINFPDKWSPKNFPYIKSIRVSQGFLQGDIFEFNESFNCLIGGAGTGKSTIIEFIRFAFDQISEHPEIQEDCFGKLRDLAGVGAVISIEVVTSSGDTFNIQRTFDSSANLIEIFDSDGNLIPDIDVKGIFPVHAYSQGEAVLISRDKLAQLELIDKHIDLSSYQRDLHNSFAALNSQVEGLTTLETIIKDKEIIKSEISTIKTQIEQRTKELDLAQETESDPAITTNQYWEAELNFLTTINTEIEETKKTIKETFDHLVLPVTQVQVPEEETPNKDLLEKVSGYGLELKSKQDEIKESLLAVLESIGEKIKQENEKWKPQYRLHKKKYREALQKQEESNVQKINEKLHELRTKLDKNNAELTKINLAQQTYNQELGKRKSYIQTITDRKERITTLRNQKIKEIGRKLRGKVHIELIKNGNRSKFLEFLDHTLTGSFASKQIKEKICDSLDPLTLSTLIQANDIEKLKEITGIEDWAERVISHFLGNPDNIYRLQGVPLEDSLKISLEIGDGDFRELSKLSGGQKATVIVLLTMIEGESPIIFDQPEDALYSPFIFDNIVGVVRETKESRQFIFATHNANIAVASDLDLGIVLEGSSSHASIESFGGLDDPQTRKLVILHLEGGEPAIVDRIKRYNLSGI